MCHIQEKRGTQGRGSCELWGHAEVRVVCVAEAGRWGHSQAAQRRKASLQPLLQSTLSTQGCFRPNFYYLPSCQPRAEKGKKEGKEILPALGSSLLPFSPLFIPKIQHQMSTLRIVVN